MKPKMPNVLFIWTDEQRADTMSCYGNNFVQTPNLNSLAAESFVFENAYCTQPVCTPSRASILSGQYPHRHQCITNNVPLPKDVPIISEMVGDEYQCAYYGKWHLGDEIVAQRGFSEWLSIEDGIYRPYYSKPEYLERRSDYHHYLMKEGFRPDQRCKDGGKVFSRKYSAVMAEAYTKASFLGQQASQFLQTHPSNSEKPFLMSVSFLEPHMPFFGPLNNLHDPAEIPIGPAFGKAPPENGSLRNRYIADQYREYGFEGFSLKTEADWRRIRANYLGLVSLVDRAVGEILQALEASGQAENTLVVYTSDHGEMMGDHAQIGKCVMHEEAVKIPLLMRVPWLKKERTRIPGRVSQIDLLPTLLEFMGAEPPEHLNGESRKAVLEGHADLNNNEVVVEWNSSAAGMVSKTSSQEAEVVQGQSWRTLIASDGWKMNLSDNDQSELYDLNSDPFELNNQFANPEQRNRMQGMVERLNQWQEKTEDSVDLKVGQE